MTIRIKTDHNVVRKGFKATWKKIPSKIEGGTIRSPNFPSNYPNNVKNKDWNLRVSSGYKVQLTFDSFTLEGRYNRPTCKYDYVEVSYAGSGGGARRYCGDSK